MATENLQQCPINLIGFGTFLASKIEARKGHNPKTKEPIEIAARVQLKFRPGKNLKDACNEKNKTFVNKYSNYFY